MANDSGGIRVILTGASGMVGGGVLLECLDNPAVSHVLMVNRKPVAMTHPRLSECIVPDFLQLDAATRELTGYDACFYCAGVSSIGMNEPKYTQLTYDVTVHFAQTVASLNPAMTFCYVSGAQTDSTEKGNSMWARVKGRTENALLRCGFRQAFNFRPGFMKPMPGQKNLKWYYRVIGFLFPLLIRLLSNQGSTLQQVGRAMINSVLKGYPKPILEIRDIKTLAAG